MCIGLSDLAIIPSPSFVQVNGTLHKFVVIYTLNDATSIWIAFLFGYLMLLQFSSLVLALMNRNITIKAVNDSKEIRRIVYITSFIFLGLFIGYFVIGNFRDVGISLYIGYLLAATMVVLLFIFVPKVRYWYQLL